MKMLPMKDIWNGVMYLWTLDDSQKRVSTDPLVWDCNTWTVSTSLAGCLANINMAVYSTDGTRIATVNGDQTLRMYDSLTGDEITRIPTKHEFDVTCVSFCQDGALLATGSRDATIRFWDVTTGLLVFSLEEANKDVLAYVSCMCFDHSGTFLITGCYNCSMKLWNMRTRKCIHTFTDAHTAPVLSVTVTEANASLPACMC